MTTLTADRGDTWYCSCGNHSEREGFMACTEDGEVQRPDSDEWEGFYRCERCYFVFTESDLIREA